MDIKQLEYIVQIAQERNLIKAAEKCYITQPALSHFITKTEQELGYPLFFRERNNWTLTPVGHLFVDGARKILSIYQDTFNQIDEYLNLPIKQIRVGVGTDRGSHLLRHAVPIFQRDFPETKLIVFERRSTQLREMLQHGEVDLIVCAWNRTYDASEEILFFLPEPMLLAAQKGTPLPSYLRQPNDRFPTVDLKDLSSEPFIFHSTRTSIRQHVEHLMKIGGITPHVCMELESSTSIINYVSNGAGIAFLQNAYSKQYQDLVDFYYVSPSIDISFCIACRKGTMLPSATKTLVSILRDLLINS